MTPSCALFPERRLDSKLVDRLHQHAEVMAEDLTQDFVHHRGGALGPDTRRRPSALLSAATKRPALADDNYLAGWGPTP